MFSIHIVIDKANCTWFRFATRQTETLTQNTIHSMWPSFVNIKMERVNLIRCMQYGTSIWPWPIYSSIGCTPFYVLMISLYPFLLCMLLCCYCMRKSCVWAVEKKNSSARRFDKDVNNKRFFSSHFSFNFSCRNGNSFPTFFHCHVIRFALIESIKWNLRCIVIWSKTWICKYIPFILMRMRCVAML